MRNFVVYIFYFLSSLTLIAQSNNVIVFNEDKGIKLLVDGEDFMINGMNWDYFPIGTNYSYSLWEQPDDIIKAALDAEMELLKKIGVNTIRQYTGVPPKWIQYICDNHGIYTMLNHPFGRYGLNINGTWVANTKYSDSITQETLVAEVTKMVKEYKDTPGLLMYLLGNENNYGLFWKGAETEDIPMENDNSNTEARALYKTFNTATLAIKEIDTKHPVAICNGDVGFIDIIAKECKDIDVFGVNMYRGVSFGDAFQVVKKKLNKPIMFTEFGADALNAKINKEDQKTQAYYLLGNWKEVYENVAGLGKTGNSIGGFTFQFSDGWWKYGQTKNLDVHDYNASWSNGGYKEDYIKGKNNMNEEWFGVCAKGQPDENGMYKLIPRAAYYVLKEVHQLHPYDDNMTLNYIDNYFKQIDLNDAISKAKSNQNN